MSCYWDIEFSAIGSMDRIAGLGRTIRELEFDADYWEELARGRTLRNKPSLFHHVETHKSGPGFVALHACRNYYGNEAMSELIARFHDLTFQGTISTDIQDNSHMLFEGRDGEMTIEYRETQSEGDPILRGEAT
jgi:hypothetical protein